MLETLFNKVRTFLKKTPTQEFSYEYCETFKNSYVCRDEILTRINASFPTSVNSCTMK